MKKRILTAVAVALLSAAAIKGAVFSAVDSSELVGFDGRSVKETAIDSNRFTGVLESGKYVSADVLNQARIYTDYDMEEQIVSISDGINLVRYDLNDRTKRVNGADSLLGNEIKVNGSEALVSVEEVAKIFNIKIAIHPAKGRILVVNDRDGYMMGQTSSAAVLKDRPDDLAADVAKISPEVHFYVGETANGWAKVVTEGLDVGYIKMDSVKTDEVPRMKYTPNMRSGKLNLTWEHVVNATPNPANIAAMQGVNVISPTWFSLVKENGASKGRESMDYIRWANGGGYELWPLASNGSSKEMTRKFVYSAKAREKYIETLLQTYKDLGFKGINIDFENMYGADKDQFTKFVSELSARFRQAGMVVSVDVTFPGGSDSWSKCYDRQALGLLADYVMVMAYDETAGSSQTSGSVASYGWVDRKMKDMVKQVAPEKIVMGMPFYTRVWTETPSVTPGKKVDVKSSAISMKYTQELLTTKNLMPVWDEKSKQNFVTYSDKNAVKKIWIEDASSIREKLSVQRNLRLAGVASWRRGYETPDIWALIDSELKN